MARGQKRMTYDSLLFDNVNGWIDIVLRRQGYSQECIHNTYSGTLRNILRNLKMIRK